MLMFVADLASMMIAGGKNSDVAYKVPPTSCSKISCPFTTASFDPGPLPIPERTGGAGGRLFDVRDFEIVAIKVCLPTPDGGEDYNCTDGTAPTPGPVIIVKPEPEQKLTPKSNPHGITAQSDVPAGCRFVPGPQRYVCPDEIQS